MKLDSQVRLVNPSGENLMRVKIVNKQKGLPGNRISLFKLAGGLGFKPRLTESESYIRDNWQ